MIITFLRNLFMDLYRQPLRTFLTLSGVVWGTFAVVLLMSAGNSISRNIEKASLGIGKGLVIGFPGVTTISYQGITKGKVVRITSEDIDAMRDKVDLIRTVSPEFSGTRNIRFKKEDLPASICGVNAEYQYMRNIIPQKGRFINADDLSLRRKICFLGNQIADDIFGKEEPVGKQVYVDGIPFTVVGVMIKKQQNISYSVRDDRSIFIPYTTFSSLYGTTYANIIVFEPVPGQSAAMIKEVRKFLAKKAGFSPEDEDAVMLWDLSEISKSFGVFIFAFRLFFMIIGSCTLLVGGIGVASIMMVVVEERIREIGIKLAVGAKRGQILRQFFVEALIIVLLGGLIGFLFAAALIMVIPAESIEEFVGHPKIDLAVVTVTTLVLLGIGSIAAVMPARKAASTDPIEALRS